MKDDILAIIHMALTDIGAPEGTQATLEQPRQPEHGDVATSVAMGLAKSMKMPPRAIAEKLVAAMQYNPAEITSVEIAGPGFINMRLSPAFYHRGLEAAIARGKDFGKSDMGQGLITNVEYVSANPTGPLHTGHSIGAALGDTIANLLHWTGHTVTREYYFNNAGNQMRMLALSVHARYRELLGLEFTWADDYYQGEYIRQIAEALREAHADGLAEPTDANIETTRAFGESWNFERIKKTLEDFNVRHDVYYNEDSLYREGKIQETIDDLTKIGRTYEKDGALWLKLEDLGRPDRVIVKSTGEPTYRLPDIAYHREKFRRGFQMMIDVFGADHIATAEDVKTAIELLGFDPERVHVVMNQMAAFVEDGEPVKFSKRSGKSLTLDNMIEEFGADVVRFFFVMRGVNTHLEFNLNLAREQSDKNPLFYLQYAHARIASVLRHAADEGVMASPLAPLAPLVMHEEVELMRQVLNFPDAVARAARDLEPQIVAEYLRELAAAFHRFYHNCRILIDDAPLRSARLRLLEITRTAFANGLAILGVSAPDRM